MITLEDAFKKLLHRLELTAKIAAEDAQLAEVPGSAPGPS